MDVAEFVLALLAARICSTEDTVSGPRFVLAVLVFDVALGFVTLRPWPGRELAVCPFSSNIVARVAVAYIAAALAGEACFAAEKGFNGEVGREMNDLCGDSRSGLSGDWGRVRELADLGDRTVDVFGG